MSFQFSGQRTPTPTVTWLSLWVLILRWPSTTITTRWSTPSPTPWCRSSRVWETSKMRVFTENLKLKGLDFGSFHGISYSRKKARLAVAIMQKNQPKIITQEFEVLCSWILTGSIAIKSKYCISETNNFSCFHPSILRAVRRCCQLCWKGIISSLLTRKWYDVAVMPPSGVDKCSMCRELSNQNEWIQNKELLMLICCIFTCPHHGSTAGEQH